MREDRNLFIIIIPWSWWSCPGGRDVRDAEMMIDTRGHPSDITWALPHTCLSKTSPCHEWVTSFQFKSSVDSKGETQQYYVLRIPIWQRSLCRTGTPRPALMTFLESVQCVQFWWKIWYCQMTRYSRVMASHHILYCTPSSLLYTLKRNNQEEYHKAQVSREICQPFSYRPLSGSPWPSSLSARLSCCLS